jgi:hypothetical protein
MRVTSTGHFGTLHQIVGDCAPDMTPAEFLSELTAIRNAYTWFLTDEQRIRATFGGESGKRVFDPLTAVAFARTGEFFPEGSWARASAAMGMSLGDCVEFVAAFNYDWHPSTRQGAIRKEVLTAVRMCEDADDSRSLPCSASCEMIDNIRQNAASV